MSWMRAMTRWSAGAAQQDRSLANPDRAFELDRWVGGGDPLRAGHPGAPVIDLFIMRGADEQHVFRLGDAVGIALLVEAVGGDRHRRCTPFRATLATWLLTELDAD
jgi:hypothetical protein